VILTLSFLASIVYAVLFYFLKRGLGKIIRTGVLIITACSGVAAIVMISVMHVVDLYTSLLVDVDYWIATSPETFTLLGFFSLSTVVAITHCVLIGIAFSKILSVHTKWLLVFSAFTKSLSLLPVAGLGYVALNEQWLFLLERNLLNNYLTLLNSVLWISAFVFSIALMSVFWDLPKNKLFMPEYPSSGQEWINKLSWPVATLCLFATLVGMTPLFFTFLFLLGLV